MKPQQWCLGSASRFDHVCSGEIKSVVLMDAVVPMCESMALAFAASMAKRSDPAYRCTLNWDRGGAVLGCGRTLGHDGKCGPGTAGA
jgi:hypothetical protein